MGNVKRSNGVLREQLTKYSTKPSICEGVTPKNTLGTNNHLRDTTITNNVMGATTHIRNRPSPLDLGMGRCDHLSAK